MHDLASGILHNRVMQVADNNFLIYPHEIDRQTFECLVEYRLELLDLLCVFPS